MALVIAALSAEGTSTIRNIGQIDCGDELGDYKLRNLGARIQEKSIRQEHDIIRKQNRRACLLFCFYFN